MNVIKIGFTLVSLGLLLILFQKDISWKEEKLITPLINEDLMFKGRIGKKYPIKINLKRKGNNLSGDLFNSFKDRKDVKGKIYDEVIIFLREYESGRETGNFLGRYISKNKITGIWTTADGKGVFSFYLYKNNQNTNINSITNTAVFKHKQTF